MTEQQSLALNDQSSSDAQQSSTQGDQSAQADASQSSQADSSSAAVTRPEGLPDSYWDTEKNALKVDPAALVTDLKERDELKAFKAADDSRKLTLPQTPDAYKVELPADFKPPEGVTFEFKTDDPLMGQARELAHQLGISQDGFSKLLGVYAAGQVQDQATIDTARKAEVGKLGVNGPARVDAVTNWLKGTVGDADAGALVASLATATQVQAYERLMQKFSSQGGATFSQQHRTQPDPDKIEGYETMSFAQRRAAQDARRVAQR